VLGVLSMIFWARIIVVAVKYVLLIMRAGNQGESRCCSRQGLLLSAPCCWLPRPRARN
jgi:K+ transporter